MKILLPLQCGYDNRRFFSFAMHFAKQTQAQVTVLYTYNVAFDYKLSQESLAKVVEIEKERIHLNLLKLIGYYQCFYNRWDAADRVKVKTLIKEENIENGIFSELKADSDFTLLLNHEYLQQNQMNNKLINKLVQSKIKILSIPLDRDYYLVDPFLENENNEVDSETHFEQILMKSEFYNMPTDINLFKQDIMVAS